MRMIVSDEIENKQIAKQYKELLQISYQTLSGEDKKLIRSAFDTACLLYTSPSPRDRG